MKSRACAAPRNDSGNFFRSFHHRWCNPRKIEQSYVKEGLQRSPNVLLSGPFKKVSQRPTELVSFDVPVCKSGTDQRRSGSHDTIGQRASATLQERVVAKTGRINYDGSI